MRLKHDHRTLEIKMALTSAPGREDSVNEQFGRMSLLVTPVTAVDLFAAGKLDSLFERDIFPL